MKRRRAPKTSTYDRYKISHTILLHLIDFMRRDNRLRDIIRLDGREYFLTKLQDGSTNIEVKDLQP